MGLVCPLNKIEDTDHLLDPLNRLLAGHSCVDSITSQTSCKIAAVVTDHNVDQFIPIPQQRRYSRFIQLAILAAHRAITHAGSPDWDPARVGVIIGSGIGGSQQMYEATLDLNNGARINPFFVPSCLINMAANMVSCVFKVTGPSLSTVSACATGAHAIMQGAQMLLDGQVDYVIAGGAEASINNLCIAGFDAMGALCTKYNDQPTRGSRPYDKNRSGFVMGEGAGVVIMQRAADVSRDKVHAILRGWGASADADHITKPNFKGAVQAIEQCLRKAQLTTVDHINAHATSTPVGDVSELQAFKTVFGERLLDIPITSNKGSIGHLLGAAGVVELILSILSAQKGLLPGIASLEELDEAAYIDGRPLRISNKAQSLSGSTFLSTSFGFGGTNAALCCDVIR